jgi:outer membrane murein-binding lipoprotein Lpp
MVLLFALMLAGCAGDRFKAPTKCDAVSAVLSNPAATRDQVAREMEMGRNNGCFGTGPG